MQRKGSRMRFFLILSLVFVFCVSLCACADQAGQMEHQLVEVVRGDLRLTVSADGNLSFVKDRRLTFGIAGTVAEVNVKEGDWVNAGTVLAKLDATSLELAVKAAELDLEMAATNYRKLTYPYSYSTFALDIPEALVAIFDAQRDLEGAIEVMRELGLSREQYSWQQYWDVWHRLEQVQERLTKARLRLARGMGEDVFISGFLPTASFWVVRTAQLNMEKAELALDSAKNDLKKAVLVAPFDGVIAAVNVKEGDILSAVDYASRTIIELVDPREMELAAWVDEIDVPAVKPGQRAIVSVDALPQVELEGRVNSVSLVPVEQAGLILYQVRISLNVSGNPGLRAGMSATADIITDERSGVLLVPSRAIGQNSEGRTVVRVLVNGKIEEREVVIGISDGLQTEVLSGLSEGEMVVVEKKPAPRPTGPFPFGE